MIGKVSVVQDDKKAIFIEFAEPVKFKIGQTVEVRVPRKKRTLPQNRMYWAYLGWLISPTGGDLQSLGHFSADALHEQIKAWFKDKHKHDFDIDKVFTTTELNTKEFKDYFDIVDKELMISFLGVDTSPFFANYEKYNEFMNSEYSKVPF